MKTVKYLVVPQTVNVRKYEVDAIELQQLLKEHKNFTNKEIAGKLDCPVTKVEHWFRTDSFFAIPDPELWLNLKKLLGIRTDRFDKAIMEFEERDRVFDKNERIYLSDGLCPTLTTMCEHERVLV